MIILPHKVSVIHHRRIAISVLRDNALLLTIQYTSLVHVSHSDIQCTMHGFYTGLKSTVLQADNTSIVLPGVQRDIFQRMNLKF